MSTPLKKVARILGQIPISTFCKAQFLNLILKHVLKGVIIRWSGREWMQVATDYKDDIGKLFIGKKNAFREA